MTDPRIIGALIEVVESLKGIERRVARAQDVAEWSALTQSRHLEHVGRDRRRQELQAYLWPEPKS